jgi:acetylornithine deacetylase
MTRNAAEQRVLDAIDFEGLLEYLCALVAVPSLTGHETPAQEHVAAQMERIGLDVDVWELDFDRLSQHPAYSAEVEREHGLGVVGILAGTGARGGRQPDPKRTR